MLTDIYPVQWAGRRAVVTLPDHIGAANAGQIRGELLAVINRGANTVIADMTTTISCDQAGTDAVVRACQRAVISGAELRLVVAARSEWRRPGLGGLDGVVCIYPSVEAAVAAGPDPAPDQEHDMTALEPDQITPAQAGDHDRLAGDLHDSVIGELFALGLTLHGHAARSEPAVAEQINGYAETLDKVITKIRTSIFAGEQG